MPHRATSYPAMYGLVTGPCKGVILGFGAKVDELYATHLAQGHSYKRCRQMKRLFIFDIWRQILESSLTPTLALIQGSHAEMYRSPRAVPAHLDCMSSQMFPRSQRQVWSPRTSIHIINVDITLLLQVIIACCIVK